MRKATNGPVRGIVLDFDGVIAQSMQRHARAYRETMAPFGVEVTDRMVFEREGGRSESLIRDFLRLAGAPEDAATVDRLSKEKQTRFRALGPSPLYPGAEALVHTARRLAKGLGMVTGTRRENLERLIPHLLPTFDVVLAQSDYTHDKPHREPYEKTAKALGIPVAHCAAVENAPHGVASARAAGYGFIVGITTTVDPAALTNAGATRVVGDHREAERALAEWAAG